MNSRLKEAKITLKEARILLSEKDLLIDQQSETIDKKSNVIAEQKSRIDVLEQYLRLERSRLYGRSSEKNPGQGEIFNEAELESCTSDNDEQIDESQSPPLAKKKGGRKGLSKSLPRHQVHINLTDEEKEGAIDTFYTVVKEELDIEPAKARVIEYLQEKAVFVDDDDKRSIKAATLPRHPLGKSIASISLLAFIVVSKYCDGLPLHRLEKILKRYGGEITRTSMANWVIRLSLQLQPLINLMREQQLSYDYLQGDETRIKVLKEPGRSPTSDKWIWVSRGGPPDKPVVLFDYNPSRGKDVPLDLFEGFRGYFQGDGYAGYDALCRQDGIKRLGCMDHVRRKFVDAKKAAPVVGKQRQVAKYDIALGKIGKLYAIERKIKNLPAAEKYARRQEQSIPVLDDLKAWLDKNISKVGKDGKTFTAMQYALNQWPTLTVYCADGRLNISNMLAENAIRPFVIGRKAWLFADTPKGAKASATHYSIIESAKANGLEPFAYLRDILKKLPYAETVEQMEALLPWNIKKAKRI